MLTISTEAVGLNHNIAKLRPKDGPASAVMHSCCTFARPVVCMRINPSRYSATERAFLTSRVGVMYHIQSPQ